MSGGYHDFTSGETLTAANLETYCELQGIMRFASAAARNSALAAVLEEGLFAYLVDSNTLTVYTGSAWSTIGPVHGAATAIVTTVTQSGAVTHTVNYASYTRVGRLIAGTVLLTMTGSGTGANAIVIGGFPEAAGGVNVIGGGYLKDASGATATFPFWAAFITTTTIRLRSDFSGGASDTYLGSTTFTDALASGDTIQFSFLYHAAADA